MKKKILEIMAGFAAPCAYGITASDASLAAAEVEAHVMEFIAWLSQNTEPRVNDNWAVLNSDFTTYTIMSANEVYKYWLNNVKK